MRLITAIIFCLFWEFVLAKSYFDINKIKHFINTHAVTKLSEKEYLSYIYQGKDLVSLLIKNDTSHLSLDQRSLYLDEIIALMWYFYSLAVQKNHGFSDGVIVLYDTNQVFYNFLYNYVRDVNQKNLSKQVIISTNPYGYGRISTHFLRDQKIFMQYGIDIRPIDHKKAQPFLPGNKSHILFGRLANGLTFIKLERYGLYYADGFVGHAIGLVKLVCSRIAAKFGQREKLLHRKEYMPQWILRTYKKINGKRCKVNAIKDLIENSNLDSADNRLEHFIETIKLRYDYPLFRYGNEVILGQREIEQHL